MALMQEVRVQTLHLLMLKVITIGKNSICVWLGGNNNQCRPKFNVQCVKFTAYHKDRRLCVYETLKMYIEQTEHFRNYVNQVNGNLLICFIKPHKIVTKDTIAIWIRIMLNISGVDTREYSIGSVRPDAARKAKAMAVPIHIMAKAGWAGQGRPLLSSITTRRLFRNLTDSKKLY